MRQSNNNLTRFAAYIFEKWGKTLHHAALCIRIASEANVKNLWLTHYSPAESNPHDYEEELKNIFENVNISDDGDKISL